MESKEFPFRAGESHGTIEDVRIVSHSGESHDTAYGLIECCRVLWRNKGVIAAVAIVGLLVGAGCAAWQVPLYQVHSSLEVQDINEEYLKQVSPISDSSGSNALTDIQTQMKIIQSDTLVRSVLAGMGRAASLNLARKRLRLTPWSGDSGVQSSLLPDEVLSEVLKRLTVRAGGQTRVIDVRFDAADPAAAAQFTNMLVSEFIEQNLSARWQLTQHAGDWLVRQIEEYRRKIQRSEEALQTYARQSGLVITPDRQNVSQEKLRQLQAELSVAQADRIVKQSRSESVLSAGADTISDSLVDDTLRDIRSKLTDLRRQEAELSTKFKADYSKTKIVRAEIATFESAREAARKALVGRILNEYTEAKRREDLLASAYATQTDVVAKDAEKAIQYSLLQRDVDTNRQIYEAMLQRVKESSIASAMKASNIRVIDPATVPQKPYAPSMPVDSVLGSTAGFLFGAAFSIFRERLNRTIQEPGDASFYVGVSELGAIPSAARTRRFGPTRLPSPLRKVKIGGSPDGTDLASGKDGGDPACVELGSWKSPHSAIAAAYRSVVTSLILDRDPDARPRVIVVTSAVSGEGKTTTASNLAITLSRRGQRILLIDGDLLRPRLQNLFSVKNNTGLVNVLVQYPRVPLSGADVVRETSLSNLYLLPAGKSLSVFSSDLLWSDALRALIAACKARFDLVLIDTPPMLEIPDARVIARLADGVIFVVRARHSTRAATRAACLRLTEDGTNIFGIVLNDWNPRVSRNGYYGHRHSRYDGRPCSACPESAEARLKTALD